MTGRRPGCARAQGFTLIELIVVMVLIAVMTGLAAPRISSFLFSDQLKTTARKLLNLVAETGQNALRDQLPYVLSFDRDRHRFLARAIGASEDGRPVAETRLTVPDDVQLVDIVSAHGGMRKDEKLELVFYPEGYVDQSVIHLRDDEGRELTIFVSPFLGSLRVLDGYIRLDDEQLRPY